MPLHASVKPHSEAPRTITGMLITIDLCCGAACLATCGAAWRLILVCVSALALCLCMLCITIGMHCNLCHGLVALSWVQSPAVVRVLCARSHSSCFNSVGPKRRIARACVSPSGSERVSVCVAFRHGLVWPSRELGSIPSRGSGVLMG